MTRESSYLVSEYGSFQYDRDDVLHLIGSVLNGGVWTERERQKLLRHVQKSGSDQWDDAAALFPSRTARDCYAQYANNLDPSLNKANWSQDEEKQLLLLVEKYDEHDWCTIAEELGTQRSPFECLQHYQRTLNKALVNNSEWTEEEDELLKEAVEEHGRNWQNVASCVPNRSATQCNNRWNKSAVCHEEVVAGKWTEEEERLLFLAAVAYGAPRLADSKKTEPELQQLLNHDAAIAPAPATSKRSFAQWKEIAVLVPGKSEIQCREKWGGSLDPTVNAAPYSSEEDARLRSVVAALQRGAEGSEGNQQPTKWALVAQYMPGRTDASVRSRYLVLEKQHARKRAQAETEGDEEAEGSAGAAGGARRGGAANKKRGRKQA